MSDMALCFILMHEIVSTVMPGMRKIRQVEANLAVSDGRGLPDPLRAELRKHRWDRVPTHWSD
jgi:aryl-alcohol dehydrogenase-like predicted oxidoreductase